MNKILTCILLLSLLLNQMLFSIETSYAEEIEKPNNAGSEQTNKTNQITSTKSTNADSTSKRIIEKNLNSTIYDLGDGSKGAEIYAGNIRYKDSSGKIVDYDNTLVENSNYKSGEVNKSDDYRYKTKSSDRTAYFPQNMSSKSPIHCNYKDYRIDLTPCKKVSSAKLVDDSDKQGERKDEKYEEQASIKYESKDNDISYEYASTNSGLKETIVLDNAKNKTIEFYVSLTGCFISSEKNAGAKDVIVEDSIDTKPGESLCLCDSNGRKTVGCIPFAYMIDSDWNYSEDCSYNIKLMDKTKDIYSYKLTVKVSEDFLKNASYPVYVDPSYTFVWNQNNSSLISTAYVCRTSPNSHYTESNTNIMCVGKRSASGDVCRSYVKFDNINTLLNGKHLDSATLYLNVQQVSGSPDIYVRRVKDSWMPSMISYSNQPAREEGFIAKKNVSSTGSKSFPLYTESIDDVTREGGTTYGFEITDCEDDSNQSSSTTTWIFNNASINSDKIPKLSITYYDMPMNTECPHISYQLYDNTGNWSTSASDGAMSGSKSSSKYARSVKFNVNANVYNVSGVKCSVYKNNAWTDWISTGNEVGTAADSGKIKAIRMRAVNSSGYVSGFYNIYYRVYVPGKGWLGWTSNEKQAGDFTSSGCISAIEAMLVPKIKYYCMYVGTDGTTLGEGNDINEAYFHLPCDKTKYIYSLGVRFNDSCMRNYHKIYIKTRLQDGSQATATTYGNTMSMCGGTTSNKIVDYCMKFKDEEMRAKYDLEHVEVDTNNDTVGGTWLKNLRYNETMYPIKSMSVQVVPRKFVRGKKACISNEYVPEIDGYSFSNNSEGFAYDSGYRIPREKYINMFGSTLGNNYYDSIGEWGGNCYGMCSTSGLFKEGFWNPDVIKTSADVGRECTFWLPSAREKKNSKLRDLIEYCQILELTSLSHGSEFQSTLGNYSAIIDHINNRNGRCLAMYVENTSAIGGYAHAVVPIKVTTYQNGNSVIDLYDPNRPEKTCQATISSNNNTTTFSYVDQDNGLSYNRAALYNIYDCNSGNSQGQFTNMLNTIWSWFTNANSSFNMLSGVDRMNVVIINSNKGQIIDEYGNDISENLKKKGMVYTSKNLEVYNLKYGKYKILNSDNARVSIANYNSSIAYESSEENEIEVCFNKDKTIKSSSRFVDGKEHDVKVKALDSSNDKFEKNLHGNNFVFYGKADKLSVKKAS